MAEISTCGIECPLDWVPLPVEPGDDVAQWADNMAEELRERSRAAGYELDREVIRKDLIERAADSRGREPFYAFAFYPDGFDAALAILEVDLIHPDATVPRISLDWLTETFSAHDFGPPEISRTELPIGPAVRIRQNFAADSSSSGQPGILLETLMYGLLPEGAESAVVLLMSWTVPGVADAMEEAADGMARTLSAEFSES